MWGCLQLSRNIYHINSVGDKVLAGATGGVLIPGHSGISSYYDALILATLLICNTGLGLSKVDKHFCNCLRKCLRN